MITTFAGTTSSTDSKMSCSRSYTRSVFKKTKLLLDDQDYLIFIDKLLSSISDGKKYSNYYDFIVAEFFGDNYKEQCFRYYYNHGPQLKDIVSREDISRMDERICQMIKSGVKFYAECGSCTESINKMRELNGTISDYEHRKRRKIT